MLGPPLGRDSVRAAAQEQYPRLPPLRSSLFIVCVRELRGGRARFGKPGSARQRGQSRFTIQNSALDKRHENRASTECVTQFIPFESQNWNIPGGNEQEERRAVTTWEDIGAWGLAFVAIRALLSLILLEIGARILESRSNPVVNFSQRSFSVSLISMIKQRRSERLFASDPIQRSSYSEGNPRWESVDESLTEFERLTR